MKNKKLWRSSLKFICAVTSALCCLVAVMCFSHFFKSRYEVHSEKTKAMQQVVHQTKKNLDQQIDQVEVFSSKLSRSLAEAMSKNPRANKIIADQIRQQTNQFRLAAVNHIEWGVGDQCWVATRDNNYADNHGDLREARWQVSSLVSCHKLSGYSRSLGWESSSKKGLIYISKFQFKDKSGQVQVAHLSVQIDLATLWHTLSQSVATFYVSQMLVNTQGDMLYHQNSDDLSHENLYVFAKHDTSLSSAVQAAFEQNSVQKMVVTKSIAGNDAEYTVVQPLHRIRLVYLFSVDQYWLAQFLTPLTIWLYWGAFLLLLSVCFLLLASLNLSLRRHSWTVSIVFSVGCLFLLGYIVAGRDHHYYAKGHLYSKQALNQKLSLLKQQYPKVVLLPTGLEVDQIHLSATKDANVVLTLWYITPKHMHYDELHPMLQVKNASRYTRYTHLETYTSSRGVVHVWRAALSVKPQNNSLLFPFDEKQITLTLQPRSSRRMMLVPDFQAYHFLNPERLPGIRQGVQLHAWSMTHANFAMTHDTRHINVGGDASAVAVSQHYLVYRIFVSRNVLSPFVLYLIPLLIVILMIFTRLVAMQVRLGEDKSSMEGLKGKIKTLVADLTYFSTLFFIISLSHNSIREQTAIQNVSYLESCYIVVYVVILVTAILLVLKSLGNCRYLYKKNGLLLKLLFWPLLSFVILLVTYGYFIY